jgi:cytochrome c553
VVEMAMDVEASSFARVHAMWTLSGLNKLDKAVIDQAINDTDWFVSMTGLRLAGKGYGNENTFPASLKKQAKTIANKETLPVVFSKYADTLATNGYLKRSADIFVDQVSGWVKQDKELLRSYKKGKDLYSKSCGACHQAHGKGLENMAPTLVESDWVSGSLSRLIGVAVHGLSGPIKVNGETVDNVPPIMPPHGYMKDEQLADILTYVRNAWGNQSERVQAGRITEYRAQVSRVLPWTEEELSSLE